MQGLAKNALVSQKEAHKLAVDHLKASRDEAGLKQEMNAKAQLDDAWVAWDSLRCFTELFKSDEISEPWDSFAYTFETNGVAAHLLFKRVPRDRAAAADAVDAAGAAPAADSAARNGSERAKRRREQIRRSNRTRAMERSPVGPLGPMSEGCRADLDACLAEHAGRVTLDLPPAPQAPPGRSNIISGVFAVVARQLKLVCAGHSHTPPPPPPPTLPHLACINPVSAPPPQPDRPCPTRPRPREPRSTADSCAESGAQ